MPSGLHESETLKSTIEQGKVSIDTINDSTSYRQHSDTIWLVGSRADSFDVPRYNVQSRVAPMLRAKSPRK
jgi:hypothetical protein